MKKMLGIGAAVIAVVALAAAALVWFAPILRVGNIEVSGNERVSQESIIEASGIANGDNFVRVDASSAASSIAQDPWISGVTVSRKLPTTVAIEVSEREAVAYLTDDEGEKLIDHEGRAFFIGTPPEEAVEITGSTGDDAAIVAAVSAVSAIPAHIRNQIDSVRVDDSHAMDLQLGDGREIHWGVDELNEQKAAALDTVLQREGEYWDISNPGLVSMR